ncbi:hypothetical protein [Aquirhabdus parva]|uniref:RNA polymerase alpha subunit C-terminal domain-containing protein n=1 Tax=Aquirhabdus parva TaxID=2283318 RepID=A0A345P9Z5_9GAMM|nr:hypothetical protein [Aquirhabdus parva]AXI04104.1 hypothetical protein HYN46_15415 [Aquirhabdus parva]
MKVASKRMSPDTSVDQLNIHPKYIGLLQAAGIETIRDFEHWTLERLATQGIGPAGLEILNRQLQYHGYTIGTAISELDDDQSNVDLSFPVLHLPASNE